jgi:hypothetical protein
MEPKIDIRDIKGPVLNSWDHAYLWFFGLALVLLVGLILFSFWKWKRKGKRTLVHLAHEIASEALIKLKEREPVEDGRIAEFYLELSQVIRVYLQGRFGYKARESTSEQLLKNLGDSGKFSEGERKRLADFFSLCDRVKFGAYLPSAEERAISLDSGEAIIKGMKEIAKP